MTAHKQPPVEALEKASNTVCKAREQRKLDCCRAPGRSPRHHTFEGGGAEGTGAFLATGFGFLYPRFDPKYPLFGTMFPYLRVQGGSKKSPQEIKV